MSQPIFSRAPLHMRYSRESLFEPKFVSIGPLYYEKLKEQKVMEKAKDECVSYFVSKLPTSKSNLDINHLVHKQLDATDMKDRIHQWYSKSRKNFVLLDNDFFEMLVRDSCFIIRIILAFSREGEESMFYPGVDIKTVRFDLLLLENQIPFFFLKKVYNIFREQKMLPPIQSSENSPSNSPDNDLIQSSSPNGNTRVCCLPIPEQNQISQTNLSLEQNQNQSPQSTLTLKQSQNQSQSRRHLLQTTPQQSQSNTPQSTPEQTTIFLDEFLKELKPFIWLDMPWQFYEHAEFTEEPKHLLDLHWKWCIPSSLKVRGVNAPNQIHDDGIHASWVKIHLRSNARKRIKSAYELYRKAGVTFQKKEHKDGFDVTFQRGILQIPHLQLDPNQTTLLANLVAFEELKPSNERLLTSYVLLLDGLINTEKDVELLQRHGVITNKLCSSQMASTYFNDIGNVCSVDYDDHYCQKQFDDLNSYYHSKWNNRFAKLRHKYFNSPWAVISFSAGATLLIFSGLQTVYNLLRYYQHR